jgi:hypothetical protein
MINLSLRQPPWRTGTPAVDIPHDAVPGNEVIVQWPGGYMEVGHWDGEEVWVQAMIPVKAEYRKYEGARVWQPKAALEGTTDAPKNFPP